MKQNLIYKPPNIIEEIKNDIAWAVKGINVVLKKLGKKEIKYREPRKKNPWDDKIL